VPPSVTSFIRPSRIATVGLVAGVGVEAISGGLGIEETAGAAGTCGAVATGAGTGLRAAQPMIETVTAKVRTSNATLNAANRFIGSLLP
jgi:hypothetical protein